MSGRRHINLNNPNSLRQVSTFMSLSSCSWRVLENTITSSRKTNASLKCTSPMYLSINLWNVLGAFVTPWGILLNSQNPSLEHQGGGCLHCLRGVLSSAPVCATTGNVSHLKVSLNHFVLPTCSVFPPTASSFLPLGWGLQDRCNVLIFTTVQTVWGLGFVCLFIFSLSLHDCICVIWLWHSALRLPYRSVAASPLSFSVT